MSNQNYDLSFRQFLIAYASADQTITDESQEHLEQLTDEYLNGLNERYYFTQSAVENYCDYIRDNLKDDEHFYFTTFRKRRYVRFLVEWIRYFAELE